MMAHVHAVRAHVTYRAIVSGGRSAELRFVADPAQATLGDAWRRLSAVHAEVDPMSLEIEIRELQTALAPQSEQSAAAPGLEDLAAPVSEADRYPAVAS